MTKKPNRIKYETKKTVYLPQYIKFNLNNKDIKMRLISRRKFIYNSIGDTFELEENECFYQTIYGWGVIIEINSGKVIDNPNDVFQGLYPIEITEEEFGDGVW